MYRTSLFLFHRDLRLEDNRSLIAALQQSQTVIPLFIIDPRQTSTTNKYRSLPCIQFMIESLIDLDQQLKMYGSQLFIFEGKPEDIIEQLCRQEKIDALYATADYTPFSRQRDVHIRHICTAYGIPYILYDDLLLIGDHAVLKHDGQPYVKFTPFYRAAQQIIDTTVHHNHFTHYYHRPIQGAQHHATLFDKILPEKSHNPAIRGGRTACLALLQSLQHLPAYAAHHDFPALDTTTHLSAHLKFTTCSVREIYHAIMQHMHAPAAIVRQLYWRDFFTLICAYFPHVLTGSFRPQYNNIAWSDNEVWFERWCTGTTGFPFVDAGMRQLNETGWMHNRARLVTASFLVKDLHINWRWGEQYFAQRLIDYDPAVNNGNWQWVAGTGCDVQPYFRIFNPWLQQKKFDQNCVYIKRWIPELKNTSPAIIHALASARGNHHPTAYPRPIVDHHREAHNSIQQFAQYARKKDGS